MSTVELRIENHALPAAALGPENPLPHFRARDENRPVRTGPGVPDADRKFLGWQVGFRVLPYRMQDSYTDVTGERTFPAAVLENRHLKATFLPALGGRLVSLVHKASGRELLDRNPVLKFSNVALRNAWFSGGVEWNLGLMGHHFLTCSPVFAARIAGPDGTPALRLYEWDRLKGFAWQTDFHLPGGSPFLFAHTRVVNPVPREQPMYWWTNMAVPETPGVRVLVPADEAFWHRGDALDFVPLPVIDGSDATRPGLNERGFEMFFRLPEAARPWIASLDAGGRGLVETSTPRLKGRKLFAWGTHVAGRRWQEYLSVPGHAYIEIQAGLARTQIESLPMGAREAWDWTEAFGLLETDPKVSHGADWAAARRCAAAALDSALPATEVESRHESFRRSRDVAPAEIMFTASGWGALERERLRAGGEADRIPACLVFPTATLGEDQAPWLALLKTGRLPARDPRDDPGPWMTQPEWESRLEGAPAKDWLAFLHLGVMRMERFDRAGAREAWERSVALSPSCWAWRNLAQLEKQEEKPEAAADSIRRAAALCPAFALPALARECVDILAHAGRDEQALEFIRSLPPAVAGGERVLLAKARLLLERGELDEVERILDRAFLDVREGERDHAEIWYAMWEKRLAAAGNVPVDDALRDRVRREYPPPRRITF